MDMDSTFEDTHHESTKPQLGPLGTLPSSPSTTDLERQPSLKRADIEEDEANDTEFPERISRTGEDRGGSQQSLATNTMKGDSTYSADYRKSHEAPTTEEAAMQESPQRPSSIISDTHVTNNTNSQESATAKETITSQNRRSLDSISIKTNITYTRVQEPQPRKHHNINKESLEPRGVQIAKCNMENGNTAHSTPRTIAQQLNASFSGREASLPLETIGSRRVIGAGPRIAEPRFSYDHAFLADPFYLPSIADDEHTYPEGGLRAWLVVFGGWCGMFASLGVLSSIASFQAYLSENQLAAESPGKIGWIFSTYAFLTFGCGVYIGPLFDAYGPRWLILPGSICIVLSIFLITECTEYWHFFLAFGVLGGVGTSLLFTPSIAAVGHFFKRRRGYATGIVATGGACGGIVFSMILQSLVPRIGFAWATRTIELMILFFCIPANLFIKTNLPPSRQSPHPDFRILAEPAFGMTVLGVFLIEWGLFIPLTYITSYALYEGYDPKLAYSMLSILNAGSLFGRWIPGLFSDMLGRFNTSILFIVVTIAVIFGIWLPFGTNTVGLVMFTVIFGFSSGSNISLTPVCIGQLCDTKDYGRYHATCYTIVSIGVLTGIPAAGGILEKCHGDYSWMIKFTGMCYAGALAALVVARGLAGGWHILDKY